VKKIFLYSSLLLAANSAFSFGEGAVSDRINKLERDLAILQKNFYSGNKPTQGKFAPSAPAVDDYEKAEGYEEVLKQHTGKLEELEHSLAAITKRLELMQKENEIRFQEINEKLKKNPASGEVKKEKIAPKNTPAATKEAKEEEVAEAGETEELESKAEFNRGVSLFRSGKYSESADIFREVIDMGESEELVGEAYFWLGETYFYRQKYDEATTNYLYSYRKYPKGKRADEALYKMGLTLVKNNKKTEACTVFKKLKIKDNPKISAKQLKTMNGEWKRLACSL